MPDAHLHSHCVTMDNAEQPIQQPANSSNRMDDDDGCSSGDDNFQEDPVEEKFTKFSGEPRDAKEKSCI